jgi:hypothetical protein
MIKLESLKTALTRAEWGFQQDVFAWAIDNYKSIDSHDHIVYLEYMRYADSDKSSIMTDTSLCSNGFNIIGRPSASGRMDRPHIVRLLPAIKIRAYPNYRGSYAIGDQVIDFYNDDDGNLQFDNFLKSSWCNSQDVSYKPSYNLYRQPVGVAFNNSQDHVNNVIAAHNNTKSELDNSYKQSLACLNRQEQDAYFSMQYRSTITPAIFRQALDLVGSRRIKSDMWGVIPSCSWLDDSYFDNLGFTLPSYKYYNSLFCAVNKFLGVKPNFGIKKHLKLIPSVNSDGSKEWSF